MRDDDYTSVFWAQGVCLPLVGFPLVPHGGDEEDGQVSRDLLGDTKQ